MYERVFSVAVQGREKKTVTLNLFFFFNFYFLSTYGKCVEQLNTLHLEMLILS